MNSSRRSQATASHVDIEKIVGVRLPEKDPQELWDVSIRNGKIDSVDPHQDRSSDSNSSDGHLIAKGRFLAPSLCHAHIHLDKCFLLQHPHYADLGIVEGTFAEAMSLTSKAKRRFTQRDLLERGRRLIEESIQFGVTHMRAFVELDADVEFKCLDAGLALKREFEDRCLVQICAFAQLPCYSGADSGDTVRRLIEEAAERQGVDVLGSTPYVEDDLTKMRMNVEWITKLAVKHGKHVDFHMDYHVDESKDPFIFETIATLRKHDWLSNHGKSVVMGHCSRLTLFKQKEQWDKLHEAMAGLPISFVGLPTSDIYMMKTSSETRGTLNVLQMHRDHSFNVAVAINNIGNAFTPQGSCDPLALASMCVGVYQAGTKQDTKLLYECISNRAKSAIGLSATTVDLVPGSPADFVLFEGDASDWRTRKSIAEVVYDAGANRMTVKGGRVTTKKSDLKPVH